VISFYLLCCFFMFFKDCKLDSIKMYADLVSVIIALYPIHIWVTSTQFTAK